MYDQAVALGDWNSGKLIVMAEIRQIHHEALAKVREVAPHADATDAESPGNFRRHDIHTFGGGMRPPSWTEVPAHLTDWIARANTFGEDVVRGAVAAFEIPPRLAELHSDFERIHPFIDGNGRVGRLVLNLMLVRFGYPPAIIYNRDRDRYLNALDRADKGDPSALAELIARSVIDNLHRLVVPNIAGPARLVPLRSLATKDVSYEALRQAARRGRLEAEMASDGTWRSTGHAVERYRKNRFKRSG